MTAFDRFDPFERRIGNAIEEIAAARTPDYLDDIFRQTARTSQRPRWIFPERWIPMDTTLTRPRFARGVQIRPLIVLALLLVIAAAAVLISGSQRRLPAPFGPAANGQVAYVSNGDIYVRDTLSGTGRVLIGGENNQIAPAFSPDGTRISYVTDIEGSDPFYLANADGSDPVQVALIQPAGNAQAFWAPDSRRMGLIYEIQGVPKLSIATVDGTSQVIELGDLRPWDLAWMPPLGERLLIRAEGAAGRMDLYSLRADGTELTPFGYDKVSDFGTQYTLSGLVVSPDGTTIAYNGTDVTHGPLNERLTHFRLHLVNVDGSNDRAIAGPDDPYVQENWPTYSPDGKWIVVHRWMFKSDRADAKGWLAIMPADGSQPARDIGPKFEGGEDTGLLKVWSPDSSRILLLARNTGLVYSVDPVSGESVQLPWTDDMPDWQRRALP